MEIGTKLWHPVIGHCILQCTFKTGLFGVVSDSYDVVKVDTKDNFTLSCLNFKVGQAVIYNHSDYTITALEEELNKVVIRFGQRSVERFAVLPSKLKVKKVEQLRLAMIDSNNKVVKAL